MFIGTQTSSIVKRVPQKSNSLGEHRLYRRAQVVFPQKTCEEKQVSYTKKARSIPKKFVDSDLSPLENLYCIRKADPRTLT